MAIPTKGKADYLLLGDYNAICYFCGRKFKASELKKHWQGFFVCPKCWEPRHPQDFVKNNVDNLNPPWTQPEPADHFVKFDKSLTVNDTLPLNDSVVVSAGYVIPTIADSVTISESTVIVADYIKNVSETVTCTEVITASITHVSPKVVNGFVLNTQTLG